MEKGQPLMFQQPAPRLPLSIGQCAEISDFASPLGLSEFAKSHRRRDLYFLHIQSAHPGMDDIQFTFFI